MTQTQVTVRPGSPADHDEVVALDLRAFEPHTSPGSPITAGQDFFERVPAEDHLMAIVDGAITGYVRLGHPTPLPASRHVTEIQGLAVDPAHRNKGIGALLVQAAIDEATRRGAHKVSLRVMGGNPTAQRLYTRLGFEVQGHLRDEFMVDGELVDDIMMALFP